MNPLALDTLTPEWIKDNKEAAQAELLRRLSQPNQYDAIKALLEAGVNPHTSSRQNRPIPLKTAMQHDLRYMELLLSYGARPQGIDPMGNVPLRWAIDQRNGEAMRLLIKAGADINEGGNLGGRSLLMYAVLQGDEDTTRILIDAGANVDQQDAQGNTLLHLLIEKPANYPELRALQLQAAELVLKAGADTYKKNRYNVDPEELLAKQCALRASWSPHEKNDESDHLLNMIHSAREAQRLTEHLNTLKASNEDSACSQGNSTPALPPDSQQGSTLSISSSAISEAPPRKRNAL